jgi:hypothetical protein
MRAVGKDGEKRLDAMDDSQLLYTNLIITTIPVASRLLYLTESVSFESTHVLGLSGSHWKKKKRRKAKQKGRKKSVSEIFRDKLDKVNAKLMQS